MLIFNQPSAITALPKDTTTYIAIPETASSELVNREHPYGEAGKLPLPKREFAIDAIDADYNHETKIMSQLILFMKSPFKAGQESPPGTSFNYNARSMTDKAIDFDEYRQRITATTGGGWHGWRAMMKQAGVQSWDSLQAVPDKSTVTPRDKINAIFSPSKGWAQQSQSSNNSREPSLNIYRKHPPVVNPSPLPIDPTLQRLLSSPPYPATTRKPASLMQRGLAAKTGPQSR